MQRMAAEILLGQLNGKSTDEEVKEVLRWEFYFITDIFWVLIYYGFKSHKDLIIYIENICSL